MVRSIGVQIGLLAFAVATIAGVYAGNPPTVILLRALLAMLLGAVVGQAAGWAAKVVLRDHLQRKKLHIDGRHFEEIRALTGEPDEVPEAVAPQSDPMKVS
jgi:MFS family permease